MPQCSDLGAGYSGVWPACTYNHDPEEIDLTRLPEHPSGEDWSMYFDAYDPTKQEMAERDAVTDISQLQDIWSLQSGQLGEAYGLKTGQLEEAWGLQQGQLGETWGLQKGQLGENWQQRKGSLGAEAGLGYRQAIGQGSQAKRKSGMAFSGGAEEMQRMGMQDVQGAYQRAFGSGQTAYEQAMESGQMGYEQAIASGQMGYQQALETAGLGYEQALATGELGLTQGTTDIYQQLEQDIYGYQQDWEKDQRSTLNVLLGMDIWGDTGGAPPANDCQAACMDAEAQCYSVTPTAQHGNCYATSYACQAACE